MDGQSFLQLSVKRSPDIRRCRAAWNPHRQLAHLVNLDAAAVLIPHGDGAEIWMADHGLIDGFNAQCEVPNAKSPREAGRCKSLRRWRNYRFHRTCQVDRRCLAIISEKQ